MTCAAKIHGGGWGAAACCALLARAGWRTKAIADDGPAIPFLTINHPTRVLFRDVFCWELEGWETSRRLVVHRPGIITEIREPMLVIDANQQLAKLWRTLPLGDLDDEDAWEIFANSRKGSAIESGSRKAWIFEGRVNASEAARCCVFEFVPDGWMFWAPVSRRKGFIQWVLPARMGDEERCRDLFEGSFLRGAVGCREMLRGAVPCAASLAKCLAGDRWISCAGSAIRFDPLSGDGTGAAIRSAILACAELRAIENASDATPYLNHYGARLALAFRSHLLMCDRLYRDGGLSGTWRTELSAIQRAIRQSDRLFPPPESIEFRLRDSALVSY